MPFNGSGVFSRIYSWVTDAANGVLVRSDRMDTDTNDIAAGLSNCITRDGQSPASANIPMGGFKLTGLANGTGSTDSCAFGQLQSIAIPALTIPTFNSPWVDAGGTFAPAGYFKDPFGQIHMQGIVTGGNTASIVFTLPVGNRPTGTLMLRLDADTTVSIESNGDFTATQADAHQVILSQVPPFRTT